MHWLQRRYRKSFSTGARYFVMRVTARRAARALLLVRAGAKEDQTCDVRAMVFHGCDSAPHKMETKLLPRSVTLRYDQQQCRAISEA